jgi:hypothetical protein
MNAVDLQRVAEQLVAEHPEWASGLRDVLDLLERVDIDLDPVDAEHVLGLLAETLERFERIERAKVAGREAASALGMSMRRLHEGLASLQAQLVWAREQRGNEASWMRQYRGPVARC